MATLKCPFCGKENPEDSQLCWFCQALLKPAEGAGAAADDADWLRALSGLEDPQPPPETEPSTAAEDWLADLRTASPEETTPDPASNAVVDLPYSPEGDEGNSADPHIDNEVLIDRLESLRMETSNQPQSESLDMGDRLEFTGKDESMEPGTDLSSDSTSEESLPDWLAELQQSRDASSEIPSIESPFSQGNSVQSGEKEDIPAFSSSPDDLSQETPDWLAGLMAEQPAPVEPDAPEPFGEAAPSFDTQLSDTSAEDALPAQPDETPDWLAGLMAEQPAPVEPEIPEPFGEAAPSFDTQLSDASAEDALPAQPDETPDWLAGLMAEQPAPAVPDAPEPFGEAAPSFDTQLSDASTDEALPAQPEETPDWLAGLMAEQPAPVEPEIPDPFVQAAPSFDAPASDTTAEDALPAQPDETPDWLAGLMAEQPAPDVPDAPEPFGEAIPSFDTQLSDASAEDALPAQPEENPDWLAGLMAEQPAPVEPDIPEPFGEAIPSFDAQLSDASAEDTLPAQPEETPDWLAGLIAGEPPANEPPAIATPPWMTSAGVGGQESGASIRGQISSPGADEDTPDWLSDLHDMLAGSASQPAAAAPPASQPDANIPDEARSVGAADGDLDWLAALPRESSQPYQPPLETIDETETENDSADWSAVESEFLSPSPEAEDPTSGAGVFTFASNETPDAEGEVAPFSGEDLPDWLSLIPTPAPDEAAEGETPELEPISPAAIPTWLEAMRPVTPLNLQQEPGSTDGEAIQPSGPLAGLRDIIASAAAATQYRKPPAYSTRVHVSERQQQQAGLLEDTISSEKQTVAAAEAARRNSQRWVRVVMGLILIAVLVATLLFTPSGAAPASAGEPAQVLPFQKIISSLPPASTVLLAADYNAGYDGEMRFSAGYVVQELIVRQSRLVWVSTLPTGATLAEKMQTDALQALARRYGQPDLSYLIADKTANLGYLAGGVTSLQEFASQPRQAARSGFGSGVDGGNVWSTPALSNIQSISDFAAVIVITDDAGIARAWVEQVKPALHGTPLLMVASAQAAPMVIPYIASGQVDAILAGMGDGMAYERLTSVNASGNNYWRAYQAGIIVIMLFTLLGVFLQSLLKSGARPKNKRKAD